MKQVFIIVAAMAVGALSFWAFSTYNISKEPVNDETDPTLAARLEAQRKVDEARKPEVPSEPEATEPEREAPEVKDSVALSYGIQNHGPFPINGTPGRPASGEVEVIESPEEKLVYFKDYQGTSGPNLRVYLSTDLEASEYFDLGEAKGTEGNLIYGVPLNVNFSEYTYVITWSESQKEVFDYAKIN